MEDLPFVAECYPPGRHAEWVPKEVGRYLENAKAAGVRTIYMPNFSRASLKIATKGELSDSTVANGITIRTNRRLPIGGLYPIEAGEGCAIGIGGCSIIVLVVAKRDVRTGFEQRFLILLHGMRDMIIDRLLVLAERERRKLLRPNSILAAATELLHRLSVLPRDVSLVSLFSIRPESFIHAPDADCSYREYNEGLPGYLGDTYPDPNLLVATKHGPGLNMPAVIRADAQRRGFGKIVTTHNLPNRETDVRGFVDTSLGPIDGKRRNLAIVYLPNH